MGKNCFSANDVIQSILQSAKRNKPLSSHTPLTASELNLLRFLTPVPKNFGLFRIFVQLFIFISQARFTSWVHKLVPNGTVSHDISSLTIDDYAKDGLPEPSELYVVLTIILSGTNFLIW